MSGEVSSSPKPTVVLCNHRHWQTHEGRARLKRMEVCILVHWWLSLGSQVERIEGMDELWAVPEMLVITKFISYCRPLGPRTLHCPVQDPGLIIRSKCLPVLLYGLDACPLIASDRSSLSFTLTRTLMKICGTTSNEIISECQTFFVFPNAYVHVNKRKCNFLRRYAVSENLICRLFHVDAERELLDCSMNSY